MSLSSSNKSPHESAELAYQAVARLFPDLIFGRGSTEYDAARGTFWNRLQQDAEPVCIFQPRTAEQVCAALTEVVRSKSTFAIKGGGHSSNLQGSSLNGGFQFDLVKLNHIEIAEDRKTVKLGPGLRWATVFEYLNREKLHTVGGRDATVGVPGFVFGGGLSNHGTVRGFGLDNLVAAEIAVTDGRLLSVDKDNHPDLYSALLGGGAHNFGIVTSLTLRTYPYKGMWGGALRHDIKHLEDQLDAFDQYNHDLESDGKAHVILDIARLDGETACAEWIAYPESLSDPPIYDPFRKIPTITDTLRLADETELAKEVHELTESTGKRNTYWTHSFVYEPRLFKKLVHTWYKGIEEAPTRLNFALEINNYTKAHRKGIALPDGQENVLGLKKYDEMLINFIIVGIWDNSEDDELVESTLGGIGEELKSIASAQGKYVPYVYMNYGNRRQDVIGSFGEEKQAFLKSVAQKYDPHAVFQTLQVGGFKLGGRWAEIQGAKV